MHNIRTFIESRYFGGKILEIDFSQLEIRVLAEITNCKRMKQELRDGMDMHCKSMAMAHDMSYQDALDWYKSGKPEAVLARRDAKTISFQKSYGAMPKNIARKSGIPLHQVQQYFTNYSLDYPEVSHAHLMWGEEVQRFAVKSGKMLTNGHEELKGTLRLRSGRFLTLKTYPTPQFLMDKGVYGQFSTQQIMNYPVQGTASDIVNMMWGYIGELILPYVAEDQAHMVATVHDSYVFDVRPEVLHELVRKLKVLLSRTPELFRATFDTEWDLELPFDIEVGDNWKDMKAYEEN